jgi:ribosomal protein L17
MAAPTKKEPKQISDLDAITFDAACSSMITDEALQTTFNRSCRLQDVTQEYIATRKSKIASKSAELAKLTRPERRVQLFRLMLGITEL